MGSWNWRAFSDESSRRREGKGSRVPVLVGVSGELGWQGFCEGEKRRMRDRSGVYLS